MKPDTATLLDDSERDAVSKVELTVLRRSTMLTPNLSALADGNAGPEMTGPRKTLSARIKRFFLELGRSLEGDHDLHKYRGG